MSRRLSRTVVGPAAVLFLVRALASPAAAFYDSGPGASRVSARGFVAAGGIVSRDPVVFHDHRVEADWSSEFRLLLDGSPGEYGNTVFELNLVESARSLSAMPLSGRRPAPAGVERSGLLAWEQHDSGNSRARFAVDILALRRTMGRADFILGRQPVNLATTFYFSPNDFFAPFAARTYFRTFKPGVDAARLEVRLADLSQLSVLGVLGYGQDHGGGTGWSRRPDWSRTSLLGRAAVTRFGFEWALLAGRVRDQPVAGGSLQGELFNWLGLRAEGHYAAAGKDGEGSGLELAVGLEHRFPGSLNLRFEQFFHGRGFRSIAEVNARYRTGDLAGGYLGRQYSAFDVNYEFSPLLTGDILLLRNWTDRSGLAALNAVYSLSDESELNAGLSLPFGPTPDQDRITSEFGRLPVSVTIEYRLYF